MLRHAFILFIALTGCAMNFPALSKTNSITPCSALVQQGCTASTIQPNTVITLQDKHVTQHQDLTLRLIAVEDSRCPTGVTCIWAGQLIVTLEVSNENTEMKVVKLIRKRDAQITSVWGYKLILLDVEPYPKEGKVIQLSDQVVKLQAAKIKVF